MKLSEWAFGGAEGSCECPQVIVCRSLTESKLSCDNRSVDEMELPASFFCLKTPFFSVQWPLFPPSSNTL